MARGRLSRPAGALLVMGVLIAAASLGELWLTPPSPAVAGPVPQAVPESGVWYCPGAAIGAGTAAVTVAAIGEEPAEITVTRYGAPAGDEPAASDHAPSSDESGEQLTVSPGEQAEVVLEGPDASAAVAVHWRGGPAVATWRVQGVPTSRAICQPASSQTWVMTGFDTAAHSRSHLRLFNPFSEDAVVSISFGTQDGLEQMRISESVPVPAGSVTTLDLNEYQPEREDLAALVTVRAGRVVAQGLLAPAPIPEGQLPHGLVALTAAGGPSNEWSFAFAAAAPGQSSWLSVFNPSERDADVEVQVSDPLPEGSALLDERSIPAGTVLRIPLSEVSATPQFGVSLQVLNDAPVVVTRFASLESGSVGASLGAAAAADSWTVTGAVASALSIYNPSGETVTATVAVRGAPQEWSAIRLLANQRIWIDLAEAGGDWEYPVIVDADRPVVAGMHAGPAEIDSAMWVLEGIPGPMWAGSGLRPSVRRDPLLATVARNWSAAGVLPPEVSPTAAPAVEPDTTPTPTPTGS
ncbi:MAG TPA: DUF5719 family protein [Egibacteraceae bacterium]|nr:DUF5719 family protein [Egibacteraceae bacterium]